MAQETIGTKAKINIAVVALMVLAGLALIAGAVLLFLFVIGGAIGGGIAGGTIAVGAMLITVGIRSVTLPQELVLIDGETLYLNKRTISLSEIQSVTAKGKTLVVTSTQGKKINQVMVKNSQDCANRIMEAKNRII